MKIFLLAGKSGSGKTYAAKIIKNYYESCDEKTVITEYSKYLKMYAKEMLDWNEENKKPRKFLQEMGSFIRHNLKDHDFFVRRMLEDLRIYERFMNNVVISDVRFPIEIEKIKKLPFKVITILFINQYEDNTLTEKEKKHESEIALDDYNNFDYVIVNDNKVTLKNEIIKIIENI